MSAMPEWTKPVGYYDPVEFRDALVCGSCGALVHPVACDSHAEFHDDLRSLAMKGDQR